MVIYSFLFQKENLLHIKNKNIIFALFLLKIILQMRKFFYF